jgi:hypothetical protein
MTIHTTQIGSCGGTLQHTTVTQVGPDCIEITRDDTVSLGTDSICIIKCDTVLDVCDTTVIVVVSLPARDTLRDTNLISGTTTVCVPVDAGMTKDTVSIINCGHSNNSGNTYSVDANNCITVVRSTTVGYNLDTLCVVSCDETKGICDTTVMIVSNLPIILPDTIRDTTPVRTTVTVCGYLPADTTGITVTACDGSTAGTGVHTSGNWTIDPVTHCLVFTASTIKGNDTLCIKVCDAHGVCTETIVIVTVTGLPPVAVDDDTVTAINTPVTIPVLNNDSTLDNDPLALCGLTTGEVIVTNPANGTVVINNNGTITYTPNNGYIGTDSFQYQICDAEGRDTAWVYITIKE